MFYQNVDSTLEISKCLLSRMYNVLSTINQEATLLLSWKPSLEAFTLRG